jgi:K+-sensing histidine kinase KdpD
LLSTCLTSIIDNAIKYGNPNGKVEVKVQKIDDFVEFKVSDEGPGFTDKALEGLFNLFSPGLKHINENEGLELAMAKLIVENHHGNIAAYNSDTGAIVSIQLPIFNGKEN